MDDAVMILAGALAKLLEATGVEEITISSDDLVEMQERGLTADMNFSEDGERLTVGVGFRDFDGDVRLTFDDGDQVVL
jgi:hypothetical protein